MKNLLTILLCLGILFGLCSFSNHQFGGNPTKEQGKIEVNFDRHLEFNDLVKIKLDMSQHGIVLDYKKIEFDDYGKLTFISFQVDCKDGFSGSATSSELTNQTRFGFFRNYVKDAEIAFGTGGL
jgi:hypothetical protein